MDTLIKIAIVSVSFALGYGLAKIKREEKEKLSDETMERIRKMGGD